MNCQEALILLYDIIDKEASDINTQQVARHLEKCRDCFEKFELEKSVDSLLKEKLNHQNASSKVDDLKAKILVKLDEVDSDCGQETKKTPFRLVAWTLAAAASLIVVMGASNLVLSFIEHGNTYMPFESAHFSALDIQQAAFDSESTQSTLGMLKDEYGFELHPTVNNFTLASGGQENIDGQEISHFVYRDNGSSVSVFIVPASQMEIPESVEHTKITVDGREMFDHRCKNCRMVYQKIGSSVVVTATSDFNIELLEFVPGHIVI